VDFWVALSDVVVIVRRLVREGWVRYRVGRDGRLDDRDLLVESLRSAQRKLQYIGHWGDALRSPLCLHAGEDKSGTR
jgi:hypothetical protein